MAVGSNVKGQSKTCRNFAAIASALSEWSLIIILLINAVLAYLATRFARLCRLPAPCLLCSRLDHILGSERRCFYRKLFCHAHKLEISSLVYCHTHKKLADLRDMCEACLLSSASVKKVNPETRQNSSAYHEDDADSHDSFKEEQDLDDATPSPNKDLEPAAPSGTRLCSCCSEPFNLQKLMQEKKQQLEGGAPNRRVPPRKRLDKPLGVDPSETRDYDLVSHVVADSELKITPDSESDVPFSDDDDDDDDDGYALVDASKDIKEKHVMRGRSPPGETNMDEGLATVVLEDVVPEKLIHPNPIAPEHTLSDTAIKPMNEDESWQKPSLKSAVEIGHGMEEISRSDVDVKTNPAELCESTPDQLPQATTDESCGVDPVLASTNPEVGKVPFSTRILFDNNDSFKNALATKGIMLSPRFSEIVSGKESYRAQDDLRLRLSRVLDLPWSDITASPRGEEFKSSDTSHSMRLQNIAKRLSMVERNYSSLENFDANLFSDIEGETSVDRLKQQIELDRKSMIALYKELEEERSAAAVAANEAMAMINRLQEDKAAMQMEALQYLRMMEEQAEYDQEAIQRLNDLLTEREKELLDLEAELESYRRPQSVATLEDKLIESIRVSELRENTPATTPRHMKFSELRENTPATTPRHMNFSESRENTPATTPRHMKLLSRSKSEKTNMMFQDCIDHGVKDLLQGFEEEKTHISEYLKTLQRKFDLLSTKQENSSLEGENAIEIGHHNSELALAMGNDELVNNVNSSENSSHSGVVSLSEDGVSPSINAALDDQLNPVEEHTTSTTSTCDSDKDKKVLDNGSSDVRTLQEEISKLIKRIEAIETDKEFLGHAISALKYGTDGVQLVQDIASQLKELRRIPTTAATEQIVA